MERLICYCLKCKSELALFINSWNAIGTSYHSPIQSPISTSGLEATGVAYGAAPESSIENSSLQDVACIECQTTLGLQCYSAPSGHLLKKEQLILNLSLMTLISESTRKKADITVVKSIPLTKSSGKRPVVNRRASTTQPLRTQLQSVPPPSRPPIPPFNLTATTSGVNDMMQQLIASNKHQSEAEKFQAWAEITIRNQQKDIDRVSMTVERVEKDMLSFKEFMEEMRRELATNRNAQKQDQETIRDLRNQISETAQRPRSRDGIDLSNKRLDAMTGDILLVNQKAHEVDQVKVDLKTMRDRLGSLEDTISARNVVYSVIPEPETATIPTNSKPSVSQPQERLIAPLPKRRHDAISNLRTPSSDPRSPPKHPSKKTKFSHKDVDNDTNDDPAEALGTQTPLVGTSKSRLTEVEIPLPMVDDFHEQESNVDDGAASERNSLLSNALRSQRTNRRRSNIEVAIPVQSNDSLISERRQLRTTTVREPNRRHSDIDLTSNKMRNSDGLRVLPNGKIDGRSLRRRRSKLEPIQNSEIMSDTSILPATYEPDNNEDTHYDQAEEVITSVEAEASSPPIPMRTTHSRANIMARSSVIGISTPTTEKPVNLRLRHIIDSVEDDHRFTTPIVARTPRLIPSSVTNSASAKEPFKCGVCEKRFQTFYALNYHHEHMEGCENRSHDETPQRIDNKPFKCGNCNKGYSSINALDYHHHHASGCTETAFDEFPTCPSCAKPYKVLSQLERHISSGACLLNGNAFESSLLTCNACGDPFKTQEQLDIHQCSRTKLKSLNFREASLAAREVRLLQREMIVRQTLDREMMDSR